MASIIVVDYYDYHFSVHLVEWEFESDAAVVLVIVSKIVVRNRMFQVIHEGTYYTATEAIE